jgi:hypothetical protein
MIRPLARSMMRGSIILLVALCACNANSPEQRLDASRKELRSWRATARLIAGEWTRNAVPSAFATRTLQAELEALGEERGDVAELASQAPASNDLLAGIDSTRSIIRSMIAEIERGHGGADTHAARLERLLLDSSSRQGARGR